MEVRQLPKCVQLAAARRAMEYYAKRGLPPKPCHSLSILFDWQETVEGAKFWAKMAVATKITEREEREIHKHC